MVYSDMFHKTITMQSLVHILKTRLAHRNNLQVKCTQHLMVVLLEEILVKGKLILKCNSYRKHFITQISNKSNQGHISKVAKFLEHSKTFTIRTQLMHKSLLRCYLSLQQFRNNKNLLSCQIQVYKCLGKTNVLLSTQLRLTVEF